MIYSKSGDIPKHENQSAPTMEQLQTDIAILRKGLEDIIQHQEVIGGHLAKASTVVFIARKALMESKDASR